MDLKAQARSIQSGQVLDDGVSMRRRSGDHTAVVHFASAPHRGMPFLHRCTQPIDGKLFLSQSPCGMFYLTAREPVAPFLPYILHPCLFYHYAFPSIIGRLSKSSPNIRFTAVRQVSQPPPPKGAPGYEAAIPGTKAKKNNALSDKWQDARAGTQKTR